MEDVVVDTSRIREQRARLGISQAELAKRVDMSQTHISMIENGQRVDIASSTLAKIARGLDISVDYLLGLTDSNKEINSSSFKGFGPLKTPNDLLEKLRHDYRRLQSDPKNTYAAFDFFVTAYHMLDWLYPPLHDKTAQKKNKEDKEHEENCNPLLQACSHIANGVKHFQATSLRHQSVKGVGLKKGGFDPAFFDPEGFDVGGLFIELDKDAAEVFGKTLMVTTLAKKVLKHWESDERLVQPEQVEDEEA